jgi:hypothetical protein
MNYIALIIKLLVGSTFCRHLDTHNAYGDHIGRPSNLKKKKQTGILFYVTCPPEVLIGRTVLAVRVRNFTSRLLFVNQPHLGHW